jgi:hypothetical protein
MVIVLWWKQPLLRFGIRIASPQNHEKASRDVGHKNHVDKITREVAACKTLNHLNGSLHLSSWDIFDGALGASLTDLSIWLTKSVGKTWGLTASCPAMRKSYDLFIRG